jgi:hypothetical protein
VLCVQVIVCAPNVGTLLFDDCSALESVQIWSDQLASLKFPGCTNLAHLDIRCDKLRASAVEHPPLRIAGPQPKPEHPPLRELVTGKLKQAEAAEKARKEANLRLECNPARVPEVYRSLGASRMGCA